MRRREGADMELGFMLTELLVVIVVLGILAATVVFALTGVTNQSARAACQSDGKSYEVAATAYQNAPGNITNAMPTTTAQLTGTAFGGPFLHPSAKNSHYVVALSGDTSPLNGAAFTLPPAATPGTIYVGPPNTQLVAYNSQTSSTGCGAVK